MKSQARHPLLTLGYALVGMLVISGLLITLARSSGESEPSVGSFSPSGLTLMASLLKDEGYRMMATRDPTPSLDPKRDAVVYITLRSMRSWTGPNKVLQGLEKRIMEFMEAGGVVVSGTLNADFQAQTRSVRPMKLKSPFSADSVTITADPTGELTPLWVRAEPETSPLWQEGPTTLVYASAGGKGRALHFSDFSLATNRFIDQHDNANVLMRCVTESVSKNRRVVFIEAAWGNAQEPGFFESIGEWAAAAWKQLLILGLVILVTLGKPFGLAQTMRPPQRGQRELVDAYATLLRRAKASDIALEAIAEDADRRVRRALKVDAGIDKADVWKYLPPELGALLAELDRACKLQVPSDIAASLADRVDRAITEFAGDRRPISRKRKKS